MKSLPVLLALLPGLVLAQQNRALTAGWADDPPALAPLVEFAGSESNLRVAVLRYAQDVAAVKRRYPVAYSPARTERPPLGPPGQRAAGATL